ncbi:hypothetical protein MP228_013157 [Amoeboaphelidium protococcarum]|nr:hypothetical protein MP228_013157 [Amoeboaphelidium protococcarum]
MYLATKQHERVKSLTLKASHCGLNIVQHGVVASPMVQITLGIQMDLTKEKKFSPDLSLLDRISTVLAQSSDDIDLTSSWLYDPGSTDFITGLIWIWHLWLVLATRLCGRKLLIPIDLQILLKPIIQRLVKIWM